MIRGACMACMQGFKGGRKGWISLFIDLVLIRNFSQAMPATGIFYEL